MEGTGGFTSLFTALLAVGCWQLCWTKCGDQALFATKTAYKLVANSNVHVEKPKGCVPVHLNMVVRHGTRFPGAKYVARFDKLAEKINKATETIDPNVNLKLPWKNPFLAELGKNLAIQGAEELFGIGRKLRARFPEVFEKVYSYDDYYFRSTCMDRAKDSAKALGKGLFYGHKSKDPLKVEFVPCEKDRLLKSYDLCEKKVVSVSDNDTALAEEDAFYDGPEMARVGEKIVRKLGLVGTKFSGKELKYLFMGCAFGIALKDGSRDAGLCSLFDEDDFKVLEYSQDVGNFYERGPGYKINADASCTLLKDMVRHMQAMIGQNNGYKKYSGIFRAAHSETIFPLNALLGVNVDNMELNSKNFLKATERKFRSGCIAPFAGNVLFTLYKCDEANNYKVQLYVNERLTRIPCCKSAVDCDFQTFQNCYSKQVEGCDFDTLCKV